MGTEFYILDQDHMPRRAASILEWVGWRVAHSDAMTVGDDWFGPGRVSTVFLGLNHRYVEGPPLLWETMIFGGPLNGFQCRYSSHADALAGHAAALARLKEPV